MHNTHGERTGRERQLLRFPLQIRLTLSARSTVLDDALSVCRGSHLSAPVYPDTSSCKWWLESFSCRQTTAAQIRTDQHLERSRSFAADASLADQAVADDLNSLRHADESTGRPLFNVELKQDMKSMSHSGENPCRRPQNTIKAV